MITNKTIANLLKLRQLSIDYDVEKISAVVISNPKFVTWSASSVEKSHHYYDGGLCDHTYEVVNITSTNLSLLDQSSYQDRIDKKELF